MRTDKTVLIAFSAPAGVGLPEATEIRIYRIPDRLHGECVEPKCLVLILEIAECAGRTVRTIAHSFNSLMQYSAKNVTLPEFAQTHRGKENAGKKLRCRAARRGLFL